MIAPVKIGAVRDIVYPRHHRWKALALLVAHFDESGTHDGAPITAIAGYVATKEAWEEIEPQWQSLVNEYADLGVEWFHMSECLSQDGQFSRVDKPSINHIITQVSGLLGHRELQPIYSGVVNDDWAAVVDDATFLQRFPTPFDLCFDDIVRQLWEWAAHRAQGERVAPVFALNPQYNDRMSAVGAAYHRGDWYPKVLEILSFGDPRRMIPLQGADLLVHQIQADLGRRRFGPLDLASMGETMALHRARGDKALYGHWFDGEGLKATLTRFQETGEIYPLNAPNQNALGAQPS